MPSFYPLPGQLPLTPPEFVPSYHSGCGGMPYQQNSFSAQPGVRQQDEGYEIADRYGQLAVAMPPMYPQAGTYLSNAPPSLPPPPNNFYESVGATILPPIRAQNGTSLGESASQQQQPRVPDHSQRANPPKDEKPVGGVSAKLDYDMEVMTDFVCEVANGIIQRGKPPPPSFRKWVHQVLCATRLPSATILLSMWYLQSRMTMLSVQAKNNEMQLYRMLTIALVLGSKFLDDNTFINRSWSEVSGIPVADLNHLEMEWLVAIDFKLHRDPSEQHGWCTWQEHWKEFEANAAVKANRANRLSPIDTTVQRQRSFNQNKPLPPLPAQQNYNQPPPYEYTPKSGQPQYTNSASSYSQYDPWLVSRSATDNSPASAPTTGPTTPEYYGGPGTWAPPGGYSRRTMFGFASHHQPVPSQPQQPTNYCPPAYTPQYNQPAWNAHPVNCGCIYCAQRHPPYFMAQGFGPQPVAV
ncbi:hypothetical protein GQ43DRAFT_85418 [Delitschia confertaspora ATCC 74209]|uniref:Cyclin n=1 Tax=Delitschia confertaspora ATCC 74209 TaxID=1513339 RepID=A0A9P4MVS6_9PLEO|nr:hypothetical protein GQ43DRAFT_85418 [Delitschia confertaspora ATCC 74209]